MKTQQPRFIWCDLEMTGLEPQRCAIIEIGLVVTDKDLNPLVEFERVIWQPESVLLEMEPFVRQMHTRNGLLERVRASEHSLRATEKEVLGLLAEHFAAGEGILAGNSIHMDRSFIAWHMPGLDRFLHYRMIDVSSLKELIRAWYPQQAGRSKVDTQHTALSDIQASIGELAFYRHHFFKTVQEVR
ncbi:MAG: oligoribonuclease [Cystobacterineae bacterium]|nr:oligoribonuclease [Cystobacterineae bacterium]